MNDLKRLLLVLEKFGYPNNNFRSLCAMTGYDPDHFLADLMENLGEDKTLEFVGNTFDKLETHSKGSYLKGIRIPLWRPEEYVYLNIDAYNVDQDEGDCVFIDWTWGDNKIFDDNDKLTTLEEIDNDNDPWDLDDFYNGIKEQCFDYINNTTGLNICWGI
jgi:hypothetical protein